MSTEAPSPAEQILWSGKASQWHFFGQWVLGLAAVAVLTLAIFLGRDTLSASLPGSMPWAYGLPALALVYFVGSITLRRAGLRYCITAKRVIIETGLFARSSNEIRVQDIRSINVKKSGISGILGIGSVEFASAATDDADVIFSSVAGADAVRDLVRKLQNQ